MKNKYNVQNVLIVTEYCVFHSHKIIACALFLFLLYSLTFEFLYTVFSFAKLCTAYVIQTKSETAAN